MKIYIAKDIIRLMDQLDNHLSNQSLGVFDEQIFVTQTEGINNWLAIQLAERQGIFAHSKFLSPTHFVNDVFKTVGLIEQDGFMLEQVKWVLYELLGQDEFCQNFKEIAEYYESDDLKRIQLATTVGDLFDQYLIYRPDFIDNWNKSESAKLFETTYKKHEKWQKWLWVELIVILEIKDRVVLRDEFFERVKEDQYADRIRKKYKSISFFGLSIFTQYHLDVIYKIAELVDVVFYLVNPSPEEYWYDDKSQRAIAFYELINKQNAEEVYLTEGNQLLQNWGKLTKEVFLMLFEQDIALDCLLQDDFVSDSNTLLQKIQSDIEKNLVGESRHEITQQDLEDGSIKIVSHYTKLREVEVLYDNIMNELHHNITLKPRDIIILVNDTQDYKPYISAVFDKKLAYNLVQETYSSESIVAVLESVFSLSEEYFTAEKSLELLEFDLIRTYFDINDLALIRRVLKDVNIRYGIKGDADLETGYVSWVYGLKKIILGYAMSIPMLDGTEKIHPYDELDTNETYQLFRFKVFVDEIIRFIEFKRSRQTVADWCDFTTSFIDRIISIEDKQVDEWKSLEHRFTLMKQVTEDVGLVDFNVFSTAMLTALHEDSSKRNLISGTITFCSMIPMRSIPYQYIAVLGLNRGEFPRASKNLGFDLIQDRKRRGDRGIREGDLALFLDIILSAKQKLYLSYIGRDVKSNESIPPSSVVTELLDYITINNSRAYKMLFTQYPINDWVSANSYSYRKPTHSAIPLVKKHQVEKVALQELPLEELIKFYKDAPKYYFEKILNIWYQKEDIIIEDTERIDLDGLDEYLLKKVLFEQGNTVELRNELVRQGDLPLLNMANVKVREFSPEVEQLKEIHQGVIMGSKKLLSKDCELELEGVRFIYTSEDLYEGGKQVLLGFSNKTVKILPQMWMKHLLLSTQEEGISTYCCLMKQEEVIVFSPLEKTEAVNILIDLLRFYKQGQEEAILFEFVISHNFLTKNTQKTGREKFYKSISQNKFKYMPSWQRLEEENYFTEDRIENLPEIANLLFHPALLSAIKTHSNKK